MVWGFFNFFVDCLAANIATQRKMIENEITKKLLADNLIREYKGVLQGLEWDLAGGTVSDRMEKIRSMDSTENAVVVIAYPKSGNHFAMSILDALGTEFDPFITYD